MFVQSENERKEGKGSDKLEFKSNKIMLIIPSKLCKKQIIKTNKCKRFEWSLNEFQTSRNFSN